MSRRTALPPELLEAIFANISAMRLFPLRDVCKLFRTTIMASPTLRRTLFLGELQSTSTSADTVAPEINPLLARKTICCRYVQSSNFNVASYCAKFSISGSSSSKV